MTSPSHQPRFALRKSSRLKSELVERMSWRGLLGPRKDVIIRLPEDVAQQLKLVAVYERTTIQDFCVHAILPSLAKALKKHGLTPPEP